MDLARDLLEQAHMLANLGERRPKQANLRRAVSSAYYALFHLLCTACSQRFSPLRPLNLASRIARVLAHGEMKDACAAIARQQLAPALLELQPAGFSDGLKRVAANFIQLQEERHAADYDLQKSYVRADVLTLVGLADEAFLLWEQVRQDEEATVFLAALLFAKRWSR